MSEHILQSIALLCYFTDEFDQTLQHGSDLTLQILAKLR